MDQVKSFGLTLIHKIHDLFFTIGSQFSVTSLATALLIAAGVIAYGRLKKRGQLPLPVLWHALFPRRILRHRSTRADVGFFIFNAFIYGSTFGLAGVSYQFLTNWLLQGLIAVAGPVTPSALPEIAQRAIVTVVLFLAYELGYWVDHYLKHRVPALWELHKVHHTAEVLTPLTTFRMHPLDSLVFGQILAVTAAIANGVTAYLFGDTTYQYALAGTNIILIVFIHLYIHLQHTHVWIAFRGALGRVFLSPAHHQIHHSTNPAHFNTNLGSCLAVWDWLFGTLYIPAKKREKLTFGIEPLQADAHTIKGEFFVPFGRAFAVMFGWLRRRSVEATPTSSADPAF
jgi:sterol desaturase/sphingolipid hydroxylase (fatty acid hydroxylase superfamily)